MTKSIYLFTLGTFLIVVSIILFELKKNHPRLLDAHTSKENAH